MRVSRVFRVSCVLALLSAPAWSGINSWTAEGPFGGSANSIAVDPANPNILLYPSPEGLWRTINGGADWTQVRADFGNVTLAFDPLHPGRVYAGAGGVYRSNDSGATFTELPQAADRPYKVAIAADGTLFGPNSTFGISRSSDEGVTWTSLPRPWPGNTNVEFVLDPNNADVLYVYVRDTGTFRSADRGATWSTPSAGSPGTNVGPQAPRDVWSFVVQPGNSNRLIAATGRGIRISNDAGATWSDAAFVRFAYWVGYHANDPQRAIAIGLHNEIMRSEDGGATWPTNLDGADPRLYGYGQGAIDRSTPGRLWATTPNGPAVSNDWGTTFALRTGDLRGGDVVRFDSALDGTLFAAFRSPVGIYRRSGSSWNQIVDLSTAFDPWSPGVQIQQFAVAPGNRSTMFATNIDRVLARSLDAGATWTVIQTDFPTPTAQVNQLAVSPTNASIAFAVTWDAGVWRTLDAGFTWTRITTLPAVVGALAIDIANPNLIYAGAGGFLPDTIYKSTDGGTNWTATGPLPGASIYAIAIDPANNDIVYVSNNNALAKTVNGGTTWTELDLGGDPGTPVNSQMVLIDPVLTTTLWSTGRRGHDGFSRSVDGGASWEPIPLPTPGTSFNVVLKATLDPEQPNRLIANPSLRGLKTFDVAPDLAVSLTGLNSTLRAGQPATASVVVSNSGPFAASDAEVLVTVPVWATPTPGAGCTFSAPTLRCRTGVIRVNASTTIPLTLALAPVSAIGAFTATVEGHETDAVPSNNTVTVDVAATPFSDLVLTMPAPMSLPRTTTVSIAPRVVNAGPDAAAFAMVSFTAPMGISLQSASVAGAPCTIVADVASCQFGALAVDASATVDITLRGETRGVVELAGQASSVSTDTDNDQSARTAITVQPLSDTSVTLVESAGTKVAGTAFSYTMTLRNDGPDEIAASGELRLVSASVSAATVSGGICTTSAAAATCTVTLASGATAAVSVTANAAVAGSVTATATVTNDGAEANAANNSATVTTTVTAPPPAPPPQKGGGGGRLDWLGLLLLGGYAAARAVRTRSIA